jgi:hypothetical protein
MAMLDASSMRRLVAVAVVGAASAAASIAGAADFRGYALRSTTAVQGLPGTTTFVTARVILPRSWKALRASPGTLRFREGNSRCSFTVALALRIRVAAAGSAEDHVAADLPVSGVRLVLDSGTRQPGAWRVTRAPTAGRLVLHGEYARVAHADAGLIPAGQAAWGELVASASSRPGDVCHSGTYRAALGPALGDAFAAVRMTAYARRA